MVSACLVGQPCRYDGRSNLRPEIAELVHCGLAVAVCPEVMGGLPTPRTPSEQKGGRVVAADGRDVTAEFTAGAEAALYIAEECGCCAAVLKARSPSCGCGRIYDGTFSRTLIEGDGIFASLLRKKGFELFTEETFVADEAELAEARSRRPQQEAGGTDPGNAPESIEDALAAILSGNVLEGFSITGADRS